MTLYVFAGPNGSGKSTIIKDFILFNGLEDIDYVCPDIYASTLFKDIADIKQRYIKAMDFAKYKRERLLNENKSMLIETVLSGQDKILFINKAKQLGYYIVSIFVGTSSPSINILRVNKRVSEGGDTMYRKNQLLIDITSLCLTLQFWQSVQTSFTSMTIVIYSQNLHCQ